MQKLNLGGCSTPEEVLESVRGRVAETNPGHWVLAVHYDQTKFPDGKHLNRHALDAISTAHPILLRHVNGHASVANTAALERAGVGADTPDPKGGEYVRDESGEATGVLFETAHEFVTSKVPNPTLEQMISAIRAAGDSMAAYDIALAADMMTGRFDLALELQAYAEAESNVQYGLYLQWATVFGPRGLGTDALKDFEKQICGIKIFADGAIGSRTAAIHGTYESGDEIGTLIYAPERLKQMVLTAHDAGYQVAIHSIGDRSTDLVLDAFEATGDPSRHRIEHVMILSDAQVERIARLGCFATCQPEFLVAFGHSYRRQLGPERASKLKRLRSLIDAGVKLSLSSDRPIVSGDPSIGIQAATQRPEGFDPGEAITREEAEHAYSVAGAEAMGRSFPIAPSN